jgi:hypothetical protein
MDVLCPPRPRARAVEASDLGSEARSSSKNACLAAFLALARSAVRSPAISAVREASEGWLLSVIGPPTSRTDRPDGIGILRYSTDERSTGILSWFHRRSSGTAATIYFIVRDGLITQLWADRDTERALLGSDVLEERRELQELCA